jgi:catechol 2,3-dioxygenase-like lactoylglutathione lyase family enzyme
MALAINHISIRTLNLEATRRFYVDALGLQVGPRPEFPFPGHWLYQGPLGAYENAAVHLIGLDPNDPEGLKQYLGERSADSLHGTGAVDHVAFFATDLTGTLLRLQQCGVQARERTVPGIGLHQLFLDDPNGVTVELNFPFAEKQAWDQAHARDTAQAAHTSGSR